MRYLNKNTINNESIDVRFETKKASGISIPNIAIYTFTLIALLVFIFPSFIGSYKFLIPIIMFLVYLLTINFLYVKPSISVLDIFWLLSFLFLVLRIKEWDIASIGYIVVYGSGVILIISSKISIESYTKVLKLIKAASLIFAISIIFQFFFLESYMKYLYPYYTDHARISLMRTLNNQRYAGIAHHVAYITIYISCGIGLLFATWEKVNLKQRKLYILFLFIMCISLVLTGDRSTIIFVCISLAIVYIISSTGITRVRRSLQISLIGVVFFLLLLFAMNNLTSIAFFERLSDTFYGAFEGEDVSNGRSILYERAWEMFLLNPLLGMGWGEFAKQNIGILIKEVESSVHNVYLQLLSEVGIIGFITFLIPIVGTYKKTYNLLSISVKNKGTAFEEYKYLLAFSLYVQTIFLLEGIIGNSLYNYSFLLPYFLVCSISMAVNNSFLNIKNRNSKTYRYNELSVFKSN